MRSESSITTSLPCQRGVHGPVASVLRGICPYRHAHHGQFQPDMLHSTAVVLLSSVLEASLRLHMSKHRSTIIAVLQVFLSLELWPASALFCGCEPTHRLMKA